MLIQCKRPVQRTPFIWLLTFVAAFAMPVALATAAPSLVVESAVKSGIYTLGQEVVFSIAGVDGADLETAAVKVIRDGSETMALPEATKNGETLEVRFTPAAAGWYMCQASLSGDRPQTVAGAGVVVSAEKITASLPAPADFDAFWKVRRDALAATPARLDLKPVTSPRAEIECFSLEAACPQTRPVHGYYARPKGAQPRSCPAILFLRAAGVAGNWCKASPENAVALAKQYGAIVVDINAHGMLNGQPAEYYQDLEQNELRRYWTQGVEDRDKFYFVGMYVRLLRSIEFLTAREQWDGRHLVTTGESQGGGQALAAAGLDPRVSAVVALVPAMCDFTAPVVKRRGGWPTPLGSDVDSERSRKVIEAVRYCDNVNWALRSRAETLIFVGLADMTCSPPGVFAVYNNLPGKKQIVAYPHKPHNGLPQEDRWIGDISDLREAFIRQHIAN